MSSDSIVKQRVKQSVKPLSSASSGKNKMTGRAARLEFRLTVESRARIEKAASLKGQTLSDFASSVLLQEADEILDQFSQRQVSESEWEKFVTLLSQPSKPNKTLKSAAARYRKGRVAGDQYHFFIGKK